MIASRIARNVILYREQHNSRSPIPFSIAKSVIISLTSADPYLLEYLSEKFFIIFLMESL
jgi:hypothetical protein